MTRPGLAWHSIWEAGTANPYCSDAWDIREQNEILISVCSTNQGLVIDVFIVKTPVVV